MGTSPCYLSKLWKDEGGRAIVQTEGAGSPAPRKQEYFCVLVWLMRKSISDLTKGKYPLTSQYIWNREENKKRRACFLITFFFKSFCLFLGPYVWHMKVLRLGVQWVLELPAYTTATVITPDPSHICDLHHSSQQCQILNPLSQGSNPQSHDS